MHRRLLLLLAPAAAATAMLAGCATFDPDTVTLSQADLERALARQFQQERRVLELFTVTTTAPQLQLLPQQDRVAVVVGFSLREPLGARSWPGQIRFDTALRWQPADQTLRLAQVRVQDLALHDPASALRSTAERLGAALAERLLEGLELYRLSAERQAELQRRGVKPGEVHVVRQGVQVRFVPLR